MSDLFIRRLVHQNNSLLTDAKFSYTEDFLLAAKPFLEDHSPGLHVLLVCAEQSTIIGDIYGENLNMVKIKPEDACFEGQWISTNNYYGVNTAKSYVDVFVIIKKYLQKLCISDKQFGLFDSYIDTAKAFEQKECDYSNILLLFNEILKGLIPEGPADIARVKIIISMPKETFHEINLIKYAPDCIKHVLLAEDGAVLLRTAPSETQKEIIDTYIEKHSNMNLKINRLSLSRDSTYGHQDKNEPSLLKYSHIELPSRELNLSVSTIKEKEAM